MATIAFPYGTADNVDSRIGRIAYRASPVLGDYPTVGQIRLHRAELERSFRAADDALRQIERRLRRLEAAVFP